MKLTTFYTAVDAGKVLDLNPVSIYVRKSTGKLKPDAKTFSGRHLYTIETLMAVKKTIKTRKKRKKKTK